MCLVGVKGAPKPLTALFHHGLEPASGEEDRGQVRHGGGHEEPRGQEGPARHPGVPPPEPPPGLPRLRPGGGVPAPGVFVHLRQRREPPRVREGPRSQAGGHRAPHRLRRGALHQVHALHPLLQRDQRHGGADPLGAGRLHPRGHLPRPPAGQPLLRLHRGRLPRGSPHEQGVPVQAAGVVPHLRQLRLQRLQPRLQRAGGHVQGRGVAPRPAGQPPGERPLDVRLRPPRQRAPERPPGSGAAQGPGRRQGSRRAVGLLCRGTAEEDGPIPGREGAGPGRGLVGPNDPGGDGGRQGPFLGPFRRE